MNKLNEAVNYQLKDLADSSWTEHGEDLDKDTHDAIRNAFGAKGNHAIIDVHGQEAQPDIDVKEHLEKHGYQIHDYKKGIARIEKQVGNPAMGIPMRSKEVHESIGKVLESKTKFKIAWFESFDFYTPIRNLWENLRHKMVK
jgi:hypothetical protein